MILNCFVSFENSSFEKYYIASHEYSIDNLNKGSITFLYKKLFSEKYGSVDFEFDININELKTLFIEINKAYEEEANKLVYKLDQAINFHKNYVLDIINFSKELSKEFNLPIKYRNLNSILPLIELILDGRAETWMEAINLFEDEKFKVKLLD